MTDQENISELVIAHLKGMDRSSAEKYLEELASKAKADTEQARQAGQVVSDEDEIENLAGQLSRLKPSGTMSYLSQSQEISSQLATKIKAVQSRTEPETETQALAREQRTLQIDKLTGELNQLLAKPKRSWDDDRRRDWVSNKLEELLREGG